jgi:hypothetical protein
MLAKFFASWLAALVLLPFTAPFSTCDVAGLLGSVHGRHTPVAPRPSAGVRERRHTDEDVTNDGAGLSVACVSPSARIRLLPPSGLPLANAKISSPRRFVQSGRSPVYIKEHTVLTTILRL